MRSYPQATRVANGVPSKGNDMDDITVVIVGDKIKVHASDKTRARTLKMFHILNLHLCESLGIDSKKTWGYRTLKPGQHNENVRKNNYIESLAAEELKKLVPDFCVSSLIAIHHFDSARFGKLMTKERLFEIIDEDRRKYPNALPDSH